MNTFSLDTNLVIPLINEIDHNRNIVLKILEQETKKCVICISVIEETKSILRDKIALAIEKSLKYLWNLNKIEDKFERDEFLIRSFKKLKENDQKNKNFYNLLYKKITEFLEEKNIEGLPNFLSELSMHMLRIVIPSIQKHIEFSLIDFDYNDYQIFERMVEIKTTISFIRFKDKCDEEIFTQLAVLAKVELIINCYTHDKEFSKKALKAISLLEEKINYAKSTLKFTFV